MNAITSTSHGLSVTDKLSQNQDNIRVMIVDDSVVVRGLVSRWIEEED